MTDRSFTTAISVNAGPEAAYAAINDVRSWWTGDIEGDLQQVGDEFAYRHGDIHYSRQQITELVPGHRVVWHVLDANLSFTATPDEWRGTDIIFELSPHDGQTEVRLTHRGLAPEIECFEQCAQAWTFYVNGSLRQRIEAGAAAD